MDELLMFVQIGKNKSDDSPDSLTQLEMFIEGKWQRRATRIIRSPI
jgi:hypothetical protein